MSKVEWPEDTEAILDEIPDGENNEELMPKQQVDREVHLRTTPGGGIMAPRKLFP